MSTFLYVERESPLHRLHPVTKIVGLALLFVPPMAFNDPRWVAGAFALSLSALCLARAYANLARTWRFLLVIFVMSTLMWALFLRDAALEAQKLLEPKLVEVWPIAVSRNSILYGLAMGFRIDAFLVAGLVFIGVTRAEELAAGLRKLLVPQSVCLALALAFRLVPTFASTGRGVAEAQMARGLDVTSGPLLARLRKYLPLIVPVLAYALRNADSLSMALESKGWSSSRPRTQYLDFRVTWADALALLLLGAVAAACVWARLEGYGELLPRL